MFRGFGPPFEVVWLARHFIPLPPGLLFWAPLFWVGFFPRGQGEAYIAIARKAGQEG